MEISDSLSAPPKPKGSKPTSPARVPSRSLGRGTKGRALDISFSAVRVVVCLTLVEAGAKAAAEVTREARRSFMLLSFGCREFDNEL